MADVDSTRSTAHAPYEDPVPLTEVCRTLSTDEVDQINIAPERAVSIIDIVRVHVEGKWLPGLRRKSPAAAPIAAADAIDQVDALINQSGALRHQMAEVRHGK